MNLTFRVQWRRQSVRWVVSASSREGKVLILATFSVRWLVLAIIYRILTYDLQAPDTSACLSCSLQDSPIADHLDENMLWNMLEIAGRISKCLKNGIKVSLGELGGMYAVLL